MKLAKISLICHGIIAILSIRQNFYYIITNVSYNIFFGLTITLICTYKSILLVNLMQYMKYNNKMLYSLLSNLLVFFTINTAEIKILILSVMIFTSFFYKYTDILIAIYYNISFITLFFNELVETKNKDYDTINNFSNDIYVFLKHTHKLYFKYMLDRTMLMFFITSGDNWISNNLIDNDGILDTISYVSVFNVISTLIFLLFQNTTISIR